MAHVEQRIAYLLERLEGSQASSYGNLGRIEEGLSDIMRQLEHQRVKLRSGRRRPPGRYDRHRRCVQARAVRRPPQPVGNRTAHAGHARSAALDAEPRRRPPRDDRRRPAPHATAAEPVAARALRRLHRQPMRRRPRCIPELPNPVVPQMSDVRLPTASPPALPSATSSRRPHLRGSRRRSACRSIRTCRRISRWSPARATAPRPGATSDPDAARGCRAGGRGQRPVELHCRRAPRGAGGSRRRQRKARPRHRADRSRAQRRREGDRQGSRSRRRNIRKALAHPLDPGRVQRRHDRDRRVQDRADLPRRFGQRPGPGRSRSRRRRPRSRLRRRARAEPEGGSSAAVPTRCSPRRRPSSVTRSSRRRMRPPRAKRLRQDRRRHRLDPAADRSRAPAASSRAGDGRGALAGQRQDSGRGRGSRAAGGGAARANRRRPTSSARASPKAAARR